ncbi:uncharacterized protein BCR38DRAFT_38697 [Pseudomassariella vexata]|uniref:Uncharacterized protein n=1 Tax=Pseudomassariella vexata TaxID=1141098 RepID=A0A1Y2DRF1_9PEZI|nr:uncharacterized protein BCR38DRAFT_38697 [Pseudomassariella vexata]ORY61714.1 hypothetical protein BCR38DRAFT_38697 [Pseudomassariella vexata]
MASFEDLPAELLHLIATSKFALPAWSPRPNRPGAPLSWQQRHDRVQPELVLRPSDLSSWARASRHLYRCILPLLYAFNRDFQSSSCVAWAARAGENSTLEKAVVYNLNISLVPKLDSPVAMPAGPPPYGHPRRGPPTCPMVHPVQLAVKSGHAATVAWFLDHGVDVEQTFRPLCEHGHQNGVFLPLLHIAMCARQSSVVSLLLDRGAPLEFKNHPWNCGRNALLQAAERGLDSIVERLVRDEGMKMYPTIVREDNALSQAVRSDNNLSTVKKLLELGAHIDGPSRIWEYSPLYDAIRHGSFKVALALLEAGASITSDASVSWYPEPLNLSLLHPAQSGHRSSPRLFPVPSPPRSFSTRSWSSSSSSPSGDDTEEQNPGISDLEEEVASDSDDSDASKTSSDSTSSSSSHSSSTVSISSDIPTNGLPRLPLLQIVAGTTPPPPPPLFPAHHPMRRHYPPNTWSTNKEAFIKRLLELGVDINGTKNEALPIVTATDCSETWIIALLLEAGADPNKPNKKRLYNGELSLNLLRRQDYNNRQKWEDNVAELLAHGARIDLPCGIDEGTILEQAAEDSTTARNATKLVILLRHTSLKNVTQEHLNQVLDLSFRNHWGLACMALVHHGARPLTQPAQSALYFTAVQTINLMQKAREHVDHEPQPTELTESLVHLGLGDQSMSHQRQLEFLLRYDLNPKHHLTLLARALKRKVLGAAHALLDYLILDISRFLNACVPEMNDLIPYLLDLTIAWGRVSLLRRLLQLPTDEQSPNLVALLQKAVLHEHRPLILFLLGQGASPLQPPPASSCSGSSQLRERSERLIAFARARRARLGKLREDDDSVNLELAGCRLLNRAAHALRRDQPIVAVSALQLSIYRANMDLVRVILHSLPRDQLNAAKGKVHVPCVLENAVEMSELLDVRQDRFVSDGLYSLAGTTIRL